MSDKEGSISRSPSRSLSREKSSSGSVKEPSPVPKVYRSRSRSLSRSRSRSRRKVSRSQSRRKVSRSPSRGSRRYSRSRSRSRSRRRNHSRSRSNSPGLFSSRHERRRGYYRSHSRSPMSNRRRHTGNRDDPNKSRCLGVFGLSLYTQERDLREIFGRYGPVDECNIVYDHQTGRSRGFAFLYMRNSSDAEEAKEKAPGMEIDGRRIRVDFSVTERAHTPTPGIYLGKPTTSDRSNYYRRSASPVSRRGGRYSRSRSRSRSYSPRRY